MTIYRCPSWAKALCFDIDNTLYRNEAYSKSQTDLLLDRLGREKGWDRERVHREMAELKEQTKTEQSQGNWFKMLGIPISTSVKWRQELLQPRQFLCPDQRLALTLSRFSRMALCALTNNPVIIGRRTLDALGVSRFFGFIIGLDTTGFSKPCPEPFMAVQKRLGIDPSGIVMIGDRYEVDLAIPLSLGWGAVLVESMEDVYTLPDALGAG
ncbi:MAG: HAD family hydrolase [Spirochaetales bacterium]|nr:HAD family hydrolase [Spirochaetales bacterium]